MNELMMLRRQLLELILLHHLICGNSLQSIVQTVEAGAANM
jgi:hypothetical protein